MIKILNWKKYNYQFIQTGELSEKNIQIVRKDAKGNDVLVANHTTFISPEKAGVGGVNLLDENGKLMTLLKSFKSKGEKESEKQPEKQPVLENYPQVLYDSKIKSNLLNK